MVKLLLAVIFGTSAQAAYFPTTTVIQPTGTQLHAVIDSAPTTAVTGTFWQATQPVSATVWPLPTGAATSALQSTLNTLMGNPFQAGGSIGNTAFGISGTLPAFAATPTFNLGTLNGAATAANQTTGNTSLGTIAANTGNIPPLGQAVAGSSVPVVLPTAQITALTPPTTVTVTQGTGSNLHVDVDSAPTTAVTGTFWQTTQPVSGSLGRTWSLNSGTDSVTVAGSITASNPSVGTDGSTGPTSSTQIGGQDGSGNLQPLQVNASKALKVDGSAVTQPVSGTFWQSTQPVSASSLPLPTGAATSALQTTINTSLGTINTTLGTPFQAGGSIGNSSFGATQSGTWNINNVSGTVSLPTGAATAANQTTINTSVQALQVAQGSTTSGQNGDLVQGAVTTSAPIYTTAKTSPISLNTSGGLRVDGSGVTQPVSGTFWQTTQPVSGTVTANAGTGTFSVSAAALPLPTGASTSALQTTINTTLGSPFQAGGSIGNTSFAATQATAASLNATAVTTGGATIAKDSSLTTINTTLGTPMQTTGGTVGLVAGSAIIGKVVPSPLVTGSGSAAAATVSTVITLTAPSNAIGFILMNWDTSTANIIWAVGRTASTTLGQQLQPGRDTGFIPIGANVSLIAASGTQTYDIQWISQ